SGFHTSYIAELEAGGKRLSDIRRLTSEENDGARGWTADGKVLVAQIRAKWGLYKQSLDSDTPEPIVSSVSGGALLLGATTPDGKWYLGRIWPDGQSTEQPTILFRSCEFRWLEELQKQYCNSHVTAMFHVPGDLPASACWLNKAKMA